MTIWLSQNISTIIISGILVILVLLAARSIYRTKKSGGCSGCSGCSHGSGSVNDNTTPTCHGCESFKDK